MDWNIFLSAAVIGAIIGAVGAAVNGLFARRFEKRKWHADLIIRPKLEALRNLHRALVESHYALNLRAEAARPQTLADFQKQVEGPREGFFDALTIAEIYLTEEASREMHAVLGSLRQISLSIWLRLPVVLLPEGLLPGAYPEDVRVPNWRLFTESFDAAHKRLGTILNPDALGAMIDEI
jgi:hypothetical protein